MTHLIDTSVWHKASRFSGIADALRSLDDDGAVFSTCPAIIAEYCFSARSARELEMMQADLSQFYLLDKSEMGDRVRTIQRSLWRHGRARAAGAVDTLIAAYALAHKQTIVTCDKGFLHISTALKRGRKTDRLHVLLLAETGTITEIY